MINRIFFYLVFLLLHISGYAQVNFKWAKSHRGLSQSDRGYATTLDLHENLYTTGMAEGRLIFDQGPDTFVRRYHSQMFVSKVDSSGVFKWGFMFSQYPNNSFIFIPPGGYGITTDLKSNVYITSSFQDTTDFDLDTSDYIIPNATTSIFILKLDANGKFKWARAFESLWGGGFDIKVDNHSNVYTVGCFFNTVDFDPGGGVYNLTSAGNYDIYISKLDSNGNFIWARRIGSKKEDRAHSLAFDRLGNLVIAGFFSDSCDFDPGTSQYIVPTNGAKDAFILKLDTAGNFIWAKSAGGPGDDVAYSVAVDSKNKVIAVGDFQHQVDFDPNAGVYNKLSAGGNDMFVWKLDSSGVLNWIQTMGGAGNEYCKSVALDTANNIYSTGAFQWVSDMNPGAASHNLTASGPEDQFVTKLDELGNFVWAHSIGGKFKTWGHGIAVSKAGNIHTTGHFKDSVDFNPTASTYTMVALLNNPTSPTGGSSEEVFISKWNNCVTAPVIITSSKSTNICPKDTVVLTASPAASYLWSTGATTRSIKVSTTDTFKVTATNSTGCPAYSSITVKVHQDTTRIDKYICQGKSFIFNGDTLKTAGVYRDTLPNFVGCDSLVILNLYIKTVDTTHIYDTLCDNIPKTFNNQNLTIAGLYRDTLYKLNGCDSHIFYHFIPKPIYQTPISRAICIGDSSLFAGKYYKISGEYRDSLKSMQNCDSIVTLTLTVRTVDTSHIYDTLCGNMPKIFNGSSLTIAGFYRDTLKNIAGCDSHIFYNFIPKPISETSLPRGICSGDSSFFGGKFYKQSGTYFDTLTTASGCDSVLKLILTVHPIDTNKQVKIICRGNSYNFYSQVLSSAGTYSHKLLNKNGCDSIIILTLSIIDSTTYSFSRNLCKNQSFIFNNQTLTQSGSYRDTLTNYLGCDSFVTLNLSFGLVLYDTIRHTTCAGQLYRSYTSPGKYQETYKSIQGCDSILTIYLTHLPATEYKTINHNACRAFSYGAQTFTRNDSFTETIKNYLLCDSIVTKHKVYITEPRPSYLADKTIDFCEEIIHKGQRKTTSFFTHDTIKSLIPPYCDSLYQPYHYRREQRPTLTPLTKQSDTVIKGETSTIQVRGAQNYRWNTGEQTPTLRPQINEDKTFEVTAWNLTDCEEKMSFYIYAIDQPIIEFPTAFSPNGDGLNDYFTPNTNGNIRIEYFQIFNRWGEKVYEHYPLSKGWDGSYLGKPSSNGLYSYTLRYSYLGRSFTKSGEVMVVR
ncbi:MAG: gliding motility-associated C-terminal domain-containing protein [Chitinophagales bacterium]|nr:gliding motility-associated C-terminal domain-containing protein [Chitinophagales bacterium]